MKGVKSIYKYNKVTQQQKFHLLTLVLRQKLLIKQAARIVGINYSTAKTIMFFNRNSSKSYQFSFRNSIALPEDHDPRQASYKQITSNSDQDPLTKVQYSKIVVINTIGNEKAACRSMIRNRGVLGNYTKRMRDESGQLYDFYMNNQKALHYHKMQRPRTRSQCSVFNLLNNSKLEHSKKDFQSSGVPQVQES